MWERIARWVVESVVIIGLIFAPALFMGAMRYEKIREILAGSPEIASGEAALSILVFFDLLIVHSIVGNARWWVFCTTMCSIFVMYAVLVCGATAFQAAWSEGNIVVSQLIYPWSFCVLGTVILMGAFVQAKIGFCYRKLNLH